MTRDTQTPEGSRRAEPSQVTVTQRKQAELGQSGPSGRGESEMSCCLDKPGLSWTLSSS